MEDIIHASGIVSESIVDGPGIRYVVFTQGCPHHCPGCQNPQTHSFEGGSDLTIGRIVEAVQENPLIAGVTFSGGEPFCQPRPLARLAEEVHALGKDVIVYSGYTFEELVASDDPDVGNLLTHCEYLIDGRFEQSRKSLMLRFRGSSNQRMIDLKTSLALGKPVAVS